MKPKPYVKLEVSISARGCLSIVISYLDSLSQESFSLEWRDSTSVDVKHWLFFSNRCTCGLRSVNFSSRVPALVNLITTRDRMRATYSRRAASKNSEVKKDEQPVIEKVSLFPRAHTL